MDRAEQNRAVFDHPDTVVEYTVPITGFLDHGEVAALVTAARTVRGRPILDVGVGGGRTTPLLLLVSEDYTALDYSPAMIDVFRRNYPGLAASVGDARDMSGIESGRYGLVVFSNNAIDAVDHDDRVRVLTELRRVVADDGIVVLATLNKGGQSFGESPFQLARPTKPLRFAPRAAIEATGRRVLDPVGSVLRVKNWRRNRHLAVDHGDWALAPLAAHGFGLLMHFTTLPDLRSLVDSAGFAVVAIYGDDGAEIPVSENTSTVDNFTVVLRPE